MIKILNQLHMAIKRRQQALTGLGKDCLCLMHALQAFGFNDFYIEMLESFSISKYYLCLSKLKFEQKYFKLLL